jgi:hypothetical protein
MFRSDSTSSMSCGVLDGAAHVGKVGQIIPAGFSASVPLDQQLNTNGNWGDNQPLPDPATLQALRDIPDGVLNYVPDVPTPEEVNLMAVLDQGLLTGLDSHVMRQMVRLLLAEGATPETAAGWTIPALRDFLANNAGLLPAATPEASATEEPTITLQDVLGAVDAYITRGG